MTDTVLRRTSEALALAGVGIAVLRVDASEPAAAAAT